jgi:hypothetical protein
MVPYGADETVYLVVDSFASGAAYRETEIERADLEAVISDLMRGELNASVRVVALNALEHWPTMCPGRSPTRYSFDAISRAIPSPTTFGTSSRATTLAPAS